MNSETNELIIIGGGLAGCEAAWQAAEHGVHVTLYEMRPAVATGAHTTPHLAELVCSNSLGSNLFNRASGLLKEELRSLNSLLIRCADSSSLPGGTALVVDRENFSGKVTQEISRHPNITLLRQEIDHIPSQPAVIASGPLTSNKLSTAIAEFLGQDNLFFYDALAPIVNAESINMQIAFRASRHMHNDDGSGDYINCPFETKEAYDDFVNVLLTAECAPLKEIDDPRLGPLDVHQDPFFNACLPVEALARLSPQALAFGPLCPVGLWNPHIRHRPYAIVQLRQDNAAGSLYNLVGFQTNLTSSEQQRVFRMIPGLENAEFVRFGHMHRNTFIASPQLLLPTLQTRSRQDLFFAGQLIGVEGYVGNIASGLLAGLNASRWLQGKRLLIPPVASMIGALCYYITQAEARTFQPMKANYGLLPPLDYVERCKNARYTAYSERAMEVLLKWKEEFEC